MAQKSFTYQELQGLVKKLETWGKGLSSDEQKILSVILQRADAISDAELDAVAGGRATVTWSEKYTKS